MQWHFCIRDQSSWYVQFRVASGENYEFTNDAEANVFKSYDFELWDLKNNTEYEIPDGEYLSVTVPVKAGYDYTIEHLLDSGAMETIVPSVEAVQWYSVHTLSARLELQEARHL